MPTTPTPPVTVEGGRVTALATRPLVERYDAVVCDLDGVVYRGPAAVANAVEVLGSLPRRVVYATNNASRTPSDVAAHLSSLGLRATADDVVTSSMAGAQELARLVPPGSEVLAVGGPGVAAALRDASLAPVAEFGSAVVAVLQGYGPNVSAADLAEAAYAVEGGATWVATNTDTTLPTDRGTAPGNGALVAAVAAAAGAEPRLVVGKPHAPLYLLCASLLGMEPRRILAVGDRLNTDIAGAVEAGMDSLLVLTGVDNLVNAALADPAERPTWVSQDLSGLRRPLEKPRRDGEWWVSGSDARTLRGTHWEARAGDADDALNAALAAIHEGLDSGALAPEAVSPLVSALGDLAQ